MGSVLTAVRKSGYLVSRFLDYVLVPRWYYRMKRDGIMRSLTDAELMAVEQRVNYYCQLQEPTPITGDISVGDYHFPYREYEYEGKRRRFTTYFFDLYEVIRYFPRDLYFCFTPGDVTTVPRQPAFVKSRPIGDGNYNAVLLKLNKRRHFTLTTHDKPYREKRDMLVARTTWANPSPTRRLLYQMFWNHPLCDVGKTRVEENEDLPWTVKPFLSREQQLQYKFVACIEGVDVATSLKWVMSSNSVAVSLPMKYETWFMEGHLIPGYHYIEVKSDYSDLIEKLQYYIAHPQEAEAIIQHAHEYVAQFTDKRIELATQLAVAKKYFKQTNGRTEN